MSEVVAALSKGIALAHPILGAGGLQSSPGVSSDAREIAASLKGMQAHRMRALVAANPKVLKRDVRQRSLKEQLYDSLEQAKVMTSKIAMHLEPAWRAQLFARLDDLMAEDEWHEDDLPLEASSFATFLRLILYLKIQRRPGLGVSHKGDLIAAWTTGNDRLTVECLPKDMIRWTLSCEIEGERERAAGETPVTRLPEVLQTYQPSRWFGERDQSARL